MKRIRVEVKLLHSLWELGDINCPVELILTKVQVYELLRKLGEVDSPRQLIFFRSAIFFLLTGSARAKIANARESPKTAQRYHESPHAPKMRKHFSGRATQQIRSG